MNVNQLTHSPEQSNNYSLKTGSHKKYPISIVP